MALVQEFNVLDVLVNLLVKGTQPPEEDLEKLLTGTGRTQMVLISVSASQLGSESAGYGITLFSTISRML